MMAGRGRTSSAAGGPARHIPVMLSEVLQALEPKDGEIIVDGTFGAGGYTEAILQAANCKVIAIDRDPEAFRLSAALVEAYPKRLVTVHARFSEMQDVAAYEAIGAVAGVVLDLGVSSMQLDEAERGFSFMKEGPLDMRMSRQGQTAADVVNTLSGAGAHRDHRQARRGAAGPRDRQSPSSRAARRSPSPRPASLPRSSCACSAGNATRPSTRRRERSRRSGSISTMSSASSPKAFPPPSACSRPAAGSSSSPSIRSRTASPSGSSPAAAPLPPSRHAICLAPKARPSRQASGFLTGVR